MDRRVLLTGISAIIAAPAIVRVASLMPIRAFAREEAPSTKNWIKIMDSDGTVGYLPVWF